MFELIPLTRSERNMLKEFDRDFYRMEKDFRREEKEIASMRTDIVEKEDCFLLQAELPGFCKEEISIDLEDGCLTIRAGVAFPADEWVFRFFFRIVLHGADG